MDIVQYPMVNILRQVGDGGIPDRIEFREIIVTLPGDLKVRIFYRNNLLFAGEYKDFRLVVVTVLEMGDDLNYVLQSLKEYARECELERLRARIKELEEAEL